MGSRNECALLKIFIMCSYICIFILKGSCLQNIAIGNCLEGNLCKNCPEDRISLGVEGRRYCCQSCHSPPMIGNATGYCICVNENKTSGRENGRIIASGHDKKYPPHNQDVTFGRPNRKFNVDSLGKALSLMADAVEKMDLRLRRVEETLGQVNLLKFGDIPIADHLMEEGIPGNSMKCKQNFVEVGSHCAFISVFTNHRANWKDAHKECNSMGATLAEVLTHSQYLALSNYLSATSTTAGYSYWMGGLYPGGIWIWLSNGQKVTLNSNYWTSVRSIRKSNREEASVIPGDTKNGRCLGLHYVMENSAYKIAADECGYEKFFICQMEKI